MPYKDKKKLYEAQKKYRNRVAQRKIEFQHYVEVKVPPHIAAPMRKQFPEMFRRSKPRKKG